MAFVCAGHADGGPSSKELMEPFADKSSFAKYYAYNSPFDIRYISQPILLGPDKRSHEEDSGKQLVWMRADGSCEVSQTMHRAMLALGCDQIMLEPILRRTGLTVMTPGISFASIDHSMWWYRDVDVTQWHLYVQDTPTAGHGRLRRTGLTVMTPGISFASIDHSMWWYRDVDVTQWHLYVQDTPTAGHGRGLSTAKVYRQDGTLVAAIVQEVMVRVPQPDPKQD